MRIFFVLNKLANCGGIERTLTDKANYMAEQGHDVTFVTYEQGMHPNVFELNPSVKHVDLDCRRFTLYKLPLHKHILELYKMKLLFRQRWNNLVVKNRPDVVVVTTYSPEFMHELMSTRKLTHIIVESHTAYTHDMKSNNFVKKCQLAYLLHNIKKCSLLIALTEGDASCWKRYVSNVKKVINPVPFFPTSINSVIKEKGRIICVGRLHEQKRYDRLIKAFSMIAERYLDWHIDIYGSGELKENLNRQIQSLNLEKRVVIHDPTNDIMTEYLKSQFFVLCSDYEGLPLVLLEAMACGLPVISTTCPFGPSEIIEDGKTGLLASMSVESLLSSMEWMICHEKQRNEMGRLARQASTMFKKEKVLKEWERVYCSIMD